VNAVLDLPLLGTEPADEEEDDTDGEVREHDTQPDVRVERVHEREDARLLLLRLLDHDADAEVHKRLAEVDHSFTHRCDRHWSNCDVGHLVVHAPIITVQTQLVKEYPAVLKDSDVVFLHLYIYLQ